MRAMRVVRPGDLPVFERVDVAEPVAGIGEVVVGVVAAALNRRDWWIWREASAVAPVTLGSDAAGVVIGVGAGIETVSVGDEVVINPALGWAAGEHVPTESFEILGSPRDGPLPIRWWCRWRVSRRARLAWGGRRRPHSALLG